MLEGQSLILELGLQNCRWAALAPEKPRATFEVGHWPLLDPKPQSVDGIAKVVREMQGHEKWNDPYKPSNWWFPLSGPY